SSSRCHAPSDPCRARISAPRPSRATRARSAAIAAGAASVRSRIACQRIAGSESSSQPMVSTNGILPSPRNAHLELEQVVRFPCALRLAQSVELVLVVLLQRDVAIDEIDEGAVGIGGHCLAEALDPVDAHLVVVPGAWQPPGLELQENLPIAERVRAVVPSAIHGAPQTVKAQIESRVRPWMCLADDEAGRDADQIQIER